MSKRVDEVFIGQDGKRCLIHTSQPCGETEADPLLQAAAAQPPPPPPHPPQTAIFNSSGETDSDLFVVRTDELPDDFDALVSALLHPIKSTEDVRGRNAAVDRFHAWCAEKKLQPVTTAYTSGNGGRVDGLNVRSIVHVRTWR
jgi:hypothetical protein